MVIIFITALLCLVGDCGAENRIWLEGARIDGKSVRMCFDSGATGIYLTKNAVKRLGLNVAPGTNGLGDTAVYTLNWGGNKFSTDFSILNDQLDCDGVMGWDYVNDNIMRIDAVAGRISPLMHAPWFGRGWTRFPIMTNTGALDIEVPHSDGTKGIISIDTGNPFGVLLSSRLWRRWRDAHPFAPVTPRVLVTDDVAFNRQEALADRIQIGPLTLENVPVTEVCSNDSEPKWGSKYDGNLGMAALDHLDIIVDGIHNAAYLRIKKKPAPPYSYNRLGALFCEVQGNPNEAGAWVMSGSPAYDAGVRNGDILVAVDGLPPMQWTTNWMAPFDLPAGTKLRFTLQRNGTNFETVATLRNILRPNDENR
jgi:hypothetical protein